jgi:signal transduction histidine kinase
MTLPRQGVLAVATTGIGTTAAGVLAWRATGAEQASGMAQYAAVAIGASLLGGFVLWHRPDSRYGRIHLAVGLLFGTVVLAAAVLAVPEGLPLWAGQLTLAWSWLALPLLLPLWVMVIAAFPDGTFHRRFLARATIAVGAAMALLATAAWLFFPVGESLPLVAVHPSPELSGPLAGWAPDGVYRTLSAAGAALGTATPLLALLALGDRYRVGGLVVRQQIKWLLAGATVSVLLQAIPVGAIESAPLRTAAGLVVVLSVPLPLLAAAVAIFKHGLWEIDVVISHGLVYAVLSGVLTAIFVAAAVAAGVTMGGGDGRVVAPVALALLVSYLAQPLRRRLVSLVGRAMYGDGPRGLLALSAQPDSHGIPDARSQGARVADVTRNALAAPWVQVWIYLHGDPAGGAFLPLAGTGRDDGPAVVVPEPSVATLVGLVGARRFADVPADTADVLTNVVGGGGDLVAALVLDGQLLGVVVCGARPGDPYGDDELALLTVLARDAALGLRNLHLEEELRRRLEDIEAQAEELRRSRQRLVNVQDQERRRIERDLHDGVQQQLVVLATGLRRAARAAGGEESAGLAGLADQAEEAVFSLQELARGIYPSVLIDQGLTAALRTQAARLPVDVRLELGPGMHGQRLPADLEAVLYYVALEAMTNAVKHAPGTWITVSLRTDDRTRLAVLEVHDDGPGFDPASPARSGLQNMADRVEAVGGRLSVESAPGAGTWVRAEVPVPATVTALQERAGSP